MPGRQHTREFKIEIVLSIEHGEKLSPSSVVSTSSLPAWCTAGPT